MNRIVIGVILIAEVKGVVCSKLPALGSVCELIKALETDSLIKNA
jgi:hypothetical protein